MSTDLSQFIETFREECSENVEAIEQGLLALEAGDHDALHAVFRAAHSIKGGAVTFGFSTVGGFTHCVETLLDRMREGRHPADRETVALLLEANDCIRMLLDQARESDQGEPPAAAALRARIERFLGDPDTQESSASPQGDPTDSDRTAPLTDGWRIEFVPDPGLFRAGHDPAAMFSVLEELGELRVQARLEALPLLAELDPELCHLSWELELRTSSPLEALQEVFEWVEDDCELVFTPLGDALAAVTDEPASPAAERAPEAMDGANEQGPREPARPTPRQAEAASIRVATSKIDQLINMVGELVITQSMLTQVGEDLDEEVTAKRIERLREGLTTLERNTRELQESIMAIRMVPISAAFNRFPRLVHDLSSQLGKEIDLELVGEQTEIDKTLIERIVDPLVHLVRNAADHGIEPPQERTARGKPPRGQVTLEAGHKGGNVVIEVRDDGRGLDPQKLLEKARAKGVVGRDAKLTEAQILDLIFAPGFSTAERVSDVSGRGVGMDVVKRNILALGGDVELRSKPWEGTTVRIVLPLTLAILDGQAIRVGSELYVIPLVSILESIRLSDARIRKPAGAIELLSWRDQQIPLLRLDGILQTPPLEDEDARGLVVIAEGGGLRAGLVVDDLLAQQQVVIKSLEENFTKLEGFSGATILGDGSIALIVDVSGIIKLAGRAGRGTRTGAPAL
ncbi:MAG: chemotaxis protein CheA, partial [Pseudomonadales bacterium]|nr:chemotaxis protein CheA [Pseudomonadales bacterium]